MVRASSNANRVFPTPPATPGLCGRRTGLVRVLSVGPGPFGPHTVHMANDTRATTYVTGAAGFIGSDLVKLLVARRHRVFGLADSVEAAERVRRAGTVPVMGDRLEHGLQQVIGPTDE
jgi:NAD dependent epimerase/dehydratase family